MKYVLGIRLSYPKGKKKYGWLTVEIIINLIQNYPHCSYHETITTLNKEITYSTELLIAMLSMLRIYVFIRLSRIIVDHRMRLIWKTYKNKKIYSFIYKSIIAHNPIIFYITSSIILLILFMLLFKPAQDIYGESISLADSLWVVAQTMLGTGTRYGPLVPQTVPSQTLTMFIVIVGKLFLASLEHKGERAKGVSAYKDDRGERGWVKCV